MNVRPAAPREALSSSLDQSASSGSKKPGGGTAAAGGTNFQAAVTAIAGVHLLRGTPIGWFENVVGDTPVGIWAESEGPGDDLRIELRDGSKIEVQAKKGLKNGNILWDALLALARGLACGELQYAVLAIAPDSSATVREKLSKDIRRIGQGRTDALTPIGEQWHAILVENGHCPQAICSQLRIVVVHVLQAQDADRKAAKSILDWVCKAPDQSQLAWSILYEDAVSLMEQRGRWDLPYLLRLLHSRAVPLRCDDYPAGIAAKLCAWTMDNRNDFALAGSRKRLPLEALLPLRVVHASFERPAFETAETALVRYHDRSSLGDRDASVLAGEWIGRFHRRNVVEAGPGLGKSTLSNKLAHFYARDGFPVLCAPLKTVAAAMAKGDSFEHAFKSLSLSGSAISLEAFDRAGFSDIVVIADGLDDCGAKHEEVAAQLGAFSKGHPHARIIVTTRPIGYETARLSDWRHYRLLPPSSMTSKDNLGKLLEALGDGSDRSDCYDLVCEQLRRLGNAGMIAASPHALGMAASLLHKNGELPETRPKLYEQLIGLFESDAALDRGISRKVTASVLDILGWCVVEKPLVDRSQLVDLCAERLAPALGVPPLAASSDVEAALAYWERAGLVEAVHHDGIELLAFIHKSFAEFAAARYLSSLPGEDFQSELTRLIVLPDWSEVVTFAAALGHGETVVSAYLAGSEKSDRSRLKPALGIALDPDAKLSGLRIAELAKAGFALVTANEKGSFSVGKGLTKLAQVHPDILGPIAREHLKAEAYPLRLVGWAVAVAAGEEYFDRGELAGALAKLIPHVSTKIFDFSFGPASLTAASDRDLMADLGLKAIQMVPPRQAQALIDRYLDNPLLAHSSFRRQVRQIADERDFDLKVTTSEMEEPSSLVERHMNPPEDERLAMVSEIRALALAVALDADDDCPAPAYGFDRYLQFAAYRSLACFDEHVTDDRYDWTQSYDAVALGHTMRAMVAISPIDPHILGAEAREIVRYLDVHPKVIPYLDLLPGYDMPAVDPDAPDWRRAASLSLDTGLLEAALLQGSIWVAYVAGNLLEQKELTRGRMAAMLAKARGVSLWAATEVVAARLPAEEALELLLEQMHQPLADGAHHMIGRMEQLGIAGHRDLQVALDAAFSARHMSTVVAAAKLALRCVEAGTKLDTASAKTAFRVWDKHDEGLQLAKGVEAFSPLEALVRLIFALDGYDETEIAILRSHRRRDVQRCVGELLKETA